MATSTGNRNDNGLKTYTAGEALAVNRVVRLSATAGQVVYPTAVTDRLIGSTVTAAASGAPVTVKLVTAPGTHSVTVNANVAMAAGGSLLYPIVAIAAGKLGADPGGGTLRALGHEASTGGDGSVIEATLLNS